MYYIYIQQILLVEEPNPLNVLCLFVLLSYQHYMTPYKWFLCLRRSLNILPNAPFIMGFIFHLRHSLNLTAQIFGTSIFHSSFLFTFHLRVLLFSCSIVNTIWSLLALGLRSMIIGDSMSIIFPVFCEIWLYYYCSAFL